MWTPSGQFSLVIAEALFVKRLKPCKLFVCDMEKRSSYSAGFNLKVIDYTENDGNRAAGHEFSVTELDDVHEESALETESSDSEYAILGKSYPFPHFS
jgi:hypothetical protein